MTEATIQETTPVATPAKDQDAATADFQSLGLSTELLGTVAKLGFATPSEIQAAIIPHLIQGRDVIGQAQTGTGKTAAFGLPLIERANAATDANSPAALVLCPTRELAMQVAEAIKSYAAHDRKFQVTAIYGGQPFREQISALRRGPHVVVGTPGRVLDHHRRGTLKMDKLQTVVLDEADEMLRMGFIDDVEIVLGAAPKACQKALFSATMPSVIRRIAQKHLTNPEEITIKSKTATVSRINQQYIVVAPNRKKEALVRVLDVQDYDGIIVFVRTKVATVDLADHLVAAGHRAIALNGDVAQNQREQIVEQMRRGKLDILVATDVVARGLDISRVSHVINYDVPQDPETYVHRVGRTGRAGRNGEAILFATPRERRVVQQIERTTRQTIAPMNIPDAATINATRIARFQRKVLTAMDGDLTAYRDIVEAMVSEGSLDIVEVAAAMASMAQGDKSLTVKEMDLTPPPRAARANEPRIERKKRVRTAGGPVEANMTRFRVEVGRTHGVKPGNLVGAIANEGDMDSRSIGRIDIFDEHSTVDLPQTMPARTLKQLQQTRVVGRPLRMAADS
ncbi:MAG: DEAD/DEAH box helicase [Halomonadaceae bacterium]|nr:MAG: DEAD/DEAH box helicase [Halomonadaceae bacterium]